MDPVSQTLAQQQSGSAGGQGFGQFLAEGARLRQNRDQLNLARRRIDLEEKQEQRLQNRDDLLLPLQERVLNAQATSLGIEAWTRSEGAMALMHQNASMPQLMKLQMEFMESPEGFADRALIDKTQKLAEKYPRAFIPGALGSELMTQIQAVPMFRQKFGQVLSMTERINQQVAPHGTAVQSINPQTGAVTFMQPRAETESTADIRNVEHLRKLRAQIAATPPGPERAELEQTLADLQSRTQPRGTIIRTNPDGSTEILQGIGHGDVTPTQRGTVHLQAAKLVDTATRVGELIAVADKVFGPMSAAQTVVVDRLLANINPSLAEGQRIQGRTKAALVKEGMIRSLSEGQGQLSNKDIERLEQAFFELGNSKEIAESPERARQVLGSIQKELARDAFERMNAVNGAPDPRVLRMMDPFVLLKEFRQKRITEEQLRDALSNTAHPKDVEELEKQL